MWCDYCLTVAAMCNTKAGTRMSGLGSRGAGSGVGELGWVEVISDPELTARTPG
jgi:hypothetical protein